MPTLMANKNNYDSDYEDYTVPELIPGEKWFIQVETDTGWRTDDLRGNEVSRGYCNYQGCLDKIKRYGRPGWRYRIAHFAVTVEEPFTHEKTEQEVARG